MHQETRKLWREYVAQVAQINAIDNPSEKFTVLPAAAQTLEGHIQQSSAFLQMVNFVGVDNQIGNPLGLGVSTTLAGRTDTSSSDRPTQDPTGMDERTYTCKQTNYDTHLTYSKLDAWRHFPNFQTLIRDQIVRQMALDRIMIGWNGASAANTTNRSNYPLLQDVNIGWLAKLASEAADRYQTEGANPNEVRVGTDGDYANLDALVWDMRSNLLDPWHRRDNTFYAIVSGELLDEKYFPIISEHGGTPTESLAFDMMVSNKKLGGLRVVEVPYFPERTLVITRLGGGQGSNLSIYTQNGTRRRTLLDNAKRDRVEDYQSVNEAYLIEDLGAMCACTNIKLPEGEGWES